MKPRFFWPFVLALALAVPLNAAQKHATSHKTKSTTSHSHKVQTHRTKSGYVYTRDLAVAHRFREVTGYPHGRKGYVVDHIVPLACGGADAITNMQWMTVADAKAKDKWERKGCQK